MQKAKLASKQNIFTIRETYYQNSNSSKQEDKKAGKDMLTTIIADNKKNTPEDSVIEERKTLVFLPWYIIKNMLTCGWTIRKALTFLEHQR